MKTFSSYWVRLLDANSALRFDVTVRISRDSFKQELEAAYKQGLSDARNQIPSAEDIEKITEPVFGESGLMDRVFGKGGLFEKFSKRY